jgi:GNAT superfamily N-acetyltransferase
VTSGSSSDGKPTILLVLVGRPGSLDCQADWMKPLTHISNRGGQFVVRRAAADDVAAIVALIADDQIGRDRDGGDLAPYLKAFAAIDADPAQLLVVVTDTSQAVVATLQLTFIPGLARRGALRAQIEAVRVSRQLRGQGVGSELLAWAIQEARRRGCALVQLTSDKRRHEAHRLYGRLGFVASHDGFKLRLAGSFTGERAPHVRSQAARAREDGQRPG